MRQYKLVIFLYSILAGTASYAADSTTCVTLNKTVTSDVQENTTIVEFFSFYCPPCYFFSQKLGIDKAIRDSLPAGQKMVKYHAGFLGELGDELTRAWSVAMVADLEERVEPLLFDAVMVSRTLKTPEDIRAASAGHQNAARGLSGSHGCSGTFATAGNAAPEWNCAGYQWPGQPPPAA